MRELQNIIFCMERGQPARIFQDFAGEASARYRVLQFPQNVICHFAVLESR